MYLFVLYTDNKFMKRSRELIGAKVFDINNNEVGVIKGIDYEHDNKIIKGFYVVKKSILSQKTYLPYQDVIEWGTKAVVISDPKILKKASFPFSSYDITYAFNRADTEIGYISDFFFDENTSDILGVEVSSSFYDDINDGRSIYANYTPNKDSGDIIIDNK